MIQKIFGLKINFNADQGAPQSGMSQDAAALFASKANSDEGGDGGGKHGLLKMHESLEKILLPLGAMNQATKTFEGLEKSSIQGALTPLTTPLPGIIQIGTTHLNILGVNLLGEKQQLNMNASAQEIVGEVQSLTGDGDGGGNGESGGSGGENDSAGENYQSQHGDMFDEGHHDYPTIEDAGQKIFNSDHDYDGPYDLSSARGAEHYENSSHHYTPDYSPPSHSHSEGRSLDD